MEKESKATQINLTNIEKLVPDNVYQNLVRKLILTVCKDNKIKSPGNGNEYIETTERSS